MNTNSKRPAFFSFLRGVFRRTEYRTDETEHGMIDAAELIALIGGDNKPITVTQALAIPDFSACVNLIASTVATMPVQLYSESEGKTEPFSDNRVILINDDTGDLLNGVQFKTALLRDYLVHGNGYAYIKRQGNRIVSLHYVTAQSVSVQKNSDPIFKDAVFRINGQSYEEYDFIKLCRNSKDGVTGTGLVSEQSELLTAQYKLLVFERVLAASGGSKKGFLQSDKKLSKPALNELRQSWKELYSKPETGVMVLNEGLKYSDANQTSVEMQLCELMREGKDAVYRMCGVPSALLSGTGTDEMWEMFYKTAILPVQKAFEATLNRDLLMYSERSSKYFAFDTKESLKGDMLKRYQAYEVAARNGFMQIDEIRYAEDLEPLGLGFIKLGLQDVLYDPKTKQIYTPNTDKSATMGESGLQSRENGDTINLRENPYRGEDGKYTFAPGGGSSGDGSSDGGYDKSNTESQDGGKSANNGNSLIVDGPNGKTIKKKHNPDDYSNVICGSSDNTERHETGRMSQKDKAKIKDHKKRHCKELGIKESEYESAGVEFLSKPLGANMEEIIQPGGKRLRYDYKTTWFAVASNDDHMITLYTIDADAWEEKVKLHGRKK